MVNGCADHFRVIPMKNLVNTLPKIEQFAYVFNNKPFGKFCNV